MEIPATAELQEQLSRTETAKVNAEFELELQKRGLEELGTEIEAALPSTASDQERAAWHDRYTLREQIPKDIANTTAQIRRIVAHVEYLTRRIEIAEERDRLQAERPEGCWCFGAGGRDPKYLPPVGEADPIQVFETHCHCVDGSAQAMRDGDAHLRGLANLRRLRVERYFGATNVPPRFRDLNFSTYPVTEQTEPVVGFLQSWARRASADTGPSVLLQGEVGRGKTGLAVATFKATIAFHGRGGLFIQAKEYLDRLKASFDGDERTAELKKAVKEAPLLILDDLGIERDTDWAQEELLDLVNYRHGYELRTIFTTNLTPKQMVDQLGPRLHGRVTEMCEYGEAVIELVGPNLRDPEERPS